MNLQSGNKTQEEGIRLSGVAIWEGKCLGKGWDAGLFDQMSCVDSAPAPGRVSLGMEL